MCPVSTGDLDYFRAVLSAITSTMAKQTHFPRICTAYLSVIIHSTMVTCINLCSPLPLIFTLNMLWVHDLVHPDIYHHLFVTELNLPIRRSISSSSISSTKHFCPDYIMLCNILTTSDWCPIHNETSVDG